MIPKPYIFSAMFIKTLFTFLLQALDMIFTMAGQGLDGPSVTLFENSPLSGKIVQ
jgi:hypothetical protein